MIVFELMFLDFSLGLNPALDVSLRLLDVSLRKLQVTYNFTSIIDMAFIFHPETYWVEIYVKFTYDLDVTYVTYFNRSSKP